MGLFSKRTDPDALASIGRAGMVLTLYPDRVERRDARGVESVPLRAVTSVEVQRAFPGSVKVVIRSTRATLELPAKAADAQAFERAVHEALAAAQ